MEFSPRRRRATGGTVVLDWLKDLGAGMLDPKDGNATLLTSQRAAEIVGREGAP